MERLRFCNANFRELKRRETRSISKESEYSHPPFFSFFFYYSSIIGLPSLLRNLEKDPPMPISKKIYQ